MEIVEAKNLIEMKKLYKNGNKKIKVTADHMFFNFMNEEINEVFIQDCNKQLFGGKTIYLGLIIRSKGQSIYDFVIDHYQELVDSIPKIDPVKSTDDDFWWKEANESNIIFKTISSPAREPELPFIKID